MFIQSNLIVVSKGISIIETKANLDETIISTTQFIKLTKIVKGGRKASIS